MSAFPYPDKNVMHQFFCIFRGIEQNVRSYQKSLPIPFVKLRECLLFIFSQERKQLFVGMGLIRRHGSQSNGQSRHLECHQKKINIQIQAIPRKSRFGTDDSPLEPTIRVKNSVVSRRYIVCRLGVRITTLVDDGTVGDVGDTFPAQKKERETEPHTITARSGLSLVGLKVSAG